ncbi:MAG: SpoIVB peptidase S55 [Acidobacteria bacterium]|nr:SpoIVB peptidase S55 [Acidobacteriota bacterium]
MQPRFNLIDVKPCFKAFQLLSRMLALPMVAVALLPVARAQSDSTSAGPPPSDGGFFPVSEVHRGQIATAWTVFTGSKPEPMQVEILGVLRGARGPGQDMILAKLKGPKPEYTGVVAGMSGSPVYIGNKLLGALSYRIGQFSKDPIAGITPIAQMLEVKNLPVTTQWASAAPARVPSATPSASSDQPAAVPLSPMNFQAMETPLVMSGFHPEAVRLWQKQMAGTGLDQIAAGGGSGSSKPDSDGRFGAISPSAIASVVPGSAVSAQLVRGDLEVSATCTVTYVDPKQLLACGHPIMQAGTVSLPMTTADVVETLASPLNAFKIVNTGDAIGTFTEDRDSAIRGVLGVKPHMIPVHITVHGEGADRKLNIEVVDLPTLTPQAILVSLYDSLLQNNQSSAETSYHVTGAVNIEGYPPSPLDLWAPAGDQGSAQLSAALQADQSFALLYANGARQGAVKAVDLDVDTIPRRAQVQLENARLDTGNIVHAGDSIVIEATVRPWQQPARNIRIPIRLPHGISSGNVRLLVSDAGTLDRALNPPRITNRNVDLETALAQAQSQHPADRIFVSLLLPDAQAGINGQTLSTLPLSMANALEPLRTAQDVTLSGESAVVAGQAPAGGVLSGFQLLSLHIEPGGGLN